MKKIMFAVAIMVGLNARAGFLDGLVDWEQVGTVLLGTSEKVNKVLEQMRLDHHAKYDQRPQWEMLCDATFVLKQNLEIVDLLLNKYNFAQPACIPLSDALKLQSNILGRCMDYYDKEVQLNFDNNFGDFMMMVEDSKDVVEKCYPFLGQFSL